MLSLNINFRASGNHPELTWSDQGKALICSEPTEGQSSPVPSSIDPAITRDPDTGDAWGAMQKNFLALLN